MLVPPKPPFKLMSLLEFIQVDEWWSLLLVVIVDKFCLKSLSKFVSVVTCDDDRGNRTI